jgi:hypothetical protein
MTTFKDFVEAWASETPPVGVVVVKNGEPHHTMLGRVNLDYDLNVPSYDFGAITSELGWETRNRLRADAVALGDRIRLPHRRFAILHDLSEGRFVSLVCANGTGASAPFRSYVFLWSDNRWFFLGDALLGRIEINTYIGRHSLASQPQVSLGPSECRDLLRLAGRHIEASLMLLHLRTESSTAAMLHEPAKGDALCRTYAHRAGGEQGRVPTSTVVYVSTEVLSKGERQRSPGQPGEGTPKSGHLRAAHYRRRPGGTIKDVPVRATTVNGGPLRHPAFEVRLRRNKTQT